MIATPSVAPTQHTQGMPLLCRLGACLLQSRGVVIGATDQDTAGAYDRGDTAHVKGRWV